MPEFGRAVSIAEFDRPMRSDDEETAQTVSYMDELAAADANEPAIVAAVAEALDQAGIDAGASPQAKAQAVYWWLKRTIRYVATPGTSPLVDQTLIPPCTLLAMPEPIGDCPQFSMLAAAMFRVLCIESLFVTIAAEPAFPEQWSHIYNTVEIYPGQFMPFDSSNGPEPGAEYAKPFKRRVWPRLSPGKCRTKEGPPMLRSTYRHTPAGMRNSVTRRAVLGDLCTDASCMATGPSVNPNDPALQMDSSYTPYSGGTYGAPSSQPWYTTLINDAAQIATPLIRSSTQQQPYFITSPSGQSVLYNPNTGTVGGGTSIGSAINPTYIIGGIAVIAALAFLSKK